MSCYKNMLRYKLQHYIIKENDSKTIYSIMKYCLKRDVDKVLKNWSTIHVTTHKKDDTSKNIKLYGTRQHYRNQQTTNMIY